MDQQVLPSLPGTVYSRCLWRAAQIVGGSEALSAKLRVSHVELVGWMADVAKPPDNVFLAAVDLVVLVDAVLDISELKAYMASSHDKPADAVPEPPPTSG